MLVHCGDVKTFGLDSTRCSRDVLYDKWYIYDHVWPCWWDV